MQRRKFELMKGKVYIDHVKRLTRIQSISLQDKYNLYTVINKNQTSKERLLYILVKVTNYKLRFNVQSAI